MDRISVTYFRSLLHRYYTPYFYYPPDTGHDQQHLVSLHTNKLFLLSLGPNHIIRRENLQVTRVTFEQKAEDIHGRKKNGAEKVRVNDVICRVECEGGRMFRVHSGVGGRIIETNDLLEVRPDLLKQPDLGYICIIQTHLTHVPKEVERLERAHPDVAYTRTE